MRHVDKTVEQTLMWLKTVTTWITNDKMSLLARKPDFAFISTLLHVNNKGADQTAHQCSLISTFVIHLIESISKLTLCNISILYSTGLKISWNRHLPCITKIIGIYYMGIFLIFSRKIKFSLALQPEALVNTSGWVLFSSPVLELLVSVAQQIGLSVLLDRKPRRQVFWRRSPN